nr:YbhB/YbcL family Raf kinase inhibitor-like protein [Anaerolineae bacterium]
MNELPYLRNETMFELVSPAFEHDGWIPLLSSCQGMDRSPPLIWYNAPDHTASFALICENHSLVIGIWTHWLIWNLPGDAEKLPLGMPVDTRLPAGVRQGLNSYGSTGYRGPCPPRSRVDHIVFRLFALDTRLSLPENTRRSRLLRHTKRHLLDEARLDGYFSLKTARERIDSRAT